MTDTSVKKFMALKSSVNVTCRSAKNEMLYIPHPRTGTLMTVRR